MPEHNDDRHSKLSKHIDRRGEFRFHVRAQNGEIISASTEGYRDKRDRDRAVDITLEALLASKTDEELAEFGVFRLSTVNRELSLAQVFDSGTVAATALLRHGEDLDR